jgi:hypothetical protein
LVVTGAGGPVEFSLVAGSGADVSVFKDLELYLPEGSIILAGKDYTDYDYLFAEPACISRPSVRRTPSGCY